MSLQEHTFKLSGPDAYIKTVHGVNSIDSGPPKPETYLLTQIESTLFNDVRDDMALRGWEYVGSGDQVPEQPVRILGEVRARLTSDAAPITGTGYDIVLSASRAAAADHVLWIEARGSAAVLLSTGNARLVIDGTTVGTPTALPLLGSAGFAMSWYLPTAANTYDVELQMNAGALGSVTPQAGCTLIIRELDR